MISGEDPSQTPGGQEYNTDAARHAQPDVEDTDGFDGILVRGAREHNLKGVDASIPRESLTVITGLSGSGKSSLAFDTIYAEGQRRYVESLSPYARQFLGLMERPEVDLIEGLSPAISIEQKTISNNPRSTVGTVTEIYDFLRLLFARAGVQHCVNCGLPVVKQTTDQIVEGVIAKYEGRRVSVLAPAVRRRKGHYQELFEKILRDGFTRVRIDGAVQEIVPGMKVDRYKIHDIEIVVDRLEVTEPSHSRLAGSIETALKFGDGSMIIADWDDALPPSLYSEKLACPVCNISYEVPEPNSFSFNSPYGACPACEGLGEKFDFSVDLIIPDRTQSLNQEAIRALGKPRRNWQWAQVLAVVEHYGHDAKTPIDQYSPEALDALLHGGGKQKYEITYTYPNGRTVKYNHRFDGVLKNLAHYLETTGSASTRQWLEAYMTSDICSVCNGGRLKPESLAVLIDGRNIHDIVALPIGDAVDVVRSLAMTDRQYEIGHLIVREISERLSFLLDVGLHYLTLNRSARTLSGGEAQRIRLATQIGSQLSGVLYVLDEPSIGLHQHDNSKLIASLKRLRDLGNTIIVVEHDRDMIESADFVIDLGPGAGELGGEVVGAARPHAFLGTSYASREDGAQAIGSRSESDGGGRSESDSQSEAVRVARTNRTHSDGDGELRAASAASDRMGRADSTKGDEAAPAGNGVGATSHRSNGTSRTSAQLMYERSGMTSDPDEHFAARFDLSQADAMHANVERAAAFSSGVDIARSLTFQYLTGEREIAVPPVRRSGNGKQITLSGASGHNLKNVDLRLPLGTFICITGLSGSGKSSLVTETLYPLLSQHFFRSSNPPLAYRSVTGLDDIDKVIDIDQSPIGRTPRSNPATYTGLFTYIRDLFTQLPESRIRGYSAGRFSFNVAGGRCEECLGDGLKKIEMNFLPDVYVNCEACDGKRYNRETLEVAFKGKSIADVLDATVADALEFFEDIPRIFRKLKTLNDVGLGYIRLGQQATTLSGGEAQRVKLATELSKVGTGRTLYVLDEPTTGLHFEDVRMLLKVLQSLVDKGNTVVIIEHNLDVIKCADWIIDLGPEGGRFGGEIVAQGTPEVVAENERSYTGQYLRVELARGGVVPVVRPSVQPTKKSGARSSDPEPETDEAPLFDEELDGEQPDDAGDDVVPIATAGAAAKPRKPGATAPKTRSATSAKRGSSEASESAADAGAKSSRATASKSSGRAGTKSAGGESKRGNAARSKSTDAGAANSINTTGSKSTSARSRGDVAAGAKSTDAAGSKSSDAAGSKSTDAVGSKGANGRAKGSNAVGSKNTDAAGSKGDGARASKGAAAKSIASKKSAAAEATRTSVSEDSYGAAALIEGDESGATQGSANSESLKSASGSPSKSRSAKSPGVSPKSATEKSTSKQSRPSDDTKLSAKTDAKSSAAKRGGKAR